MIDLLHALLAEHGILLVFLVVLLDQGGVPLPAWPPLVVASAQAVERGDPVWPILLAATLAALLADMLWYVAGRHHGARMLRLICRVSLSPDSCVSGTRAIFARWDTPSLLVAKFIPGFAAVGTTLAGHQRTPLARFALYDGSGVLLWAGVAVFAGVLFHDAVNDALLMLESLGRIGIALVLAALLGFVLRKAWLRQRCRRRLRGERIGVAELQGLLAQATPPLLMDVRSDAERALGGWIPGALALDEIPAADNAATREAVVYCDCPDEASAARVAGELGRRGFDRVRALAGGLQAWRRQGLPLQTVPDDACRHHHHATDLTVALSDCNGVCP